MIKKITSLQNPIIKNAILLQEKSKERKNQGLFVVEGIREVEMALKNNYSISTIFYTEDGDNLNKWSQINQEKHIVVSSIIFEKMTYRGKASSVLAIFQEKEHLLGNLKISDNPFFLIVEGGEKPGNLGAILRTADATNISGVIFSNMPSDLYNPNLIRSSLGACFTVPIALARNEEILFWLKKNKINTYVTHLESSKNCFEIDFCQATAIVLGEEATGVSSFWSDGQFEHIIIPMNGTVNSLNLSNSAAILSYEGFRQRNQ